MKRPGSDAAAWTVVGAALAVPALVLGAWAAVRSIPDPTAAGRPVAPLVVAVTSAQRTPSVVVTVKVATADGQHALSGVAGTVTSAPRVGDVLSNGAVVARIDDRPVRAMVGAAPLWRRLAAGDQGPDVQRLGQFLVATGYLATGGQTFDTRFAAAVAAFNRDAGAAGGTTTFDPASVAWVGPTPLTVARVDATVGASVVPGAPLVTGPSVATAVSVAEPAGGLGAAFGKQAILAVGGVTVPYAVGSGAVTAPDDVAALVGALGAVDSGTGEVRTAQPEKVRVVPASALVTGADGATTCVYADTAARPVVVTPVGGGASTVQLGGSFTLDRVLANPGQVALAVPCGS